MDTEELRSLVLRLNPGELRLVKRATGHLLVTCRVASGSDRFLFEQATAPKVQPQVVIRRNADRIADDQLFDGRLQRQRWRHRTVGEVSGGI